MKQLFLFILLLLFGHSQAQWLNQNPGAGGQVQALDPDPNTDGVVYFSSDVEGVYRSDNNGLSWTYVGYELRFNMTFGVTVEPGNSNRIYSAGAGGLHISNNRGANWPEYTLAGYPLSKAYVNPTNVNQVFATAGFRYKNQVPVGFQNAQSNVPISGRRLIFRSNDRGVTWDSLEYEAVAGYRNSYSLDFDPANANTLYLGAAAGLYRSTNSGTAWSKLPQPAGTFNCYGACLSPDGQYIYASFATVSNPNASGSQTTTTTRLYVSPTSSITSAGWRVLDANGWNLGQTNAATGATTTAFNGAWWTPKMDPRSTPTQHKIIIGTASNARQGLYEGTFNLSGGTVSSYNWLRVFYARGSVNPGSTAPFTYEPGWEDFIPGAQAFNYTPASWAERGIWVTGLQNYYYANTATPGFPYNDAWQNRYTITVANAGTNSETYETRGTACTVNYDATGFNNYGIQGQADNGIMESWDGGASWAPRSKPPTTQTEAVEIANIGPGKTPVVLAHGQPNAFGGGGTGGSLYAKRLVTSSPSDVWAHVGGGPAARAGLPNATIRDIAVDPSNTQRAYLGMFNNGTAGGGIMLIEDVEAFYNGNAVVGGGHNTNAATSVPILDITAAPLATGPAQAAIDAASIISLAVDPNNAAVLYATAPGALYRGTKAGANWNWVNLVAVGNPAPSVFNSPEVAVWDYNGVTYLALKGHLNGLVTNAPSGVSVALSRDGGATWTFIMSEATAEALRPLAWHDAANIGLNPGDMVGYGNRLFIGWHTFGYNKGFGVFEGTVANNNSTMVTWKDFSGDIHFPRIRRMRITRNSTDDKVWLYASTQGNGGWKRELLSNEVSLSCAPSITVNTTGSNCTAEVDFTATAVGSSGPVQFFLNYGSADQKEITTSYAFPVGTTLVTAVATAPAGNSVSCTQEITVNDATPPLIGTCTAAVDFCFTDKNASGVFSIPAIAATDNCGNPTYRFKVKHNNEYLLTNGSGNDASGVFPVGISTIEWTVSDAAGNETTCATTVTVNPELSVSIPAATAPVAGVKPNTVYTGYAPAASLTLSAVPAGGTPGYTYVWRLNNQAVGTGETYTASLGGTYTLTLTDAKGCTAATSISIATVDVRCGAKMDKVLVCKRPVGNNGIARNICVDPADVANHLVTGSTLGSCPATPGNSLSAVAMSEGNKELNAPLSVYPSPATGKVVVQLPQAGQNARLHLVSVSGSVLLPQRVPAGAVQVNLDLSTLAAGQYFLLYHSGSKQYQVKLVKQ